MRAALALPVRRQQALGRELVGRQAPALGHRVGPLLGLQPGDRGAGDVDGVRRAEGLGQDVVDAGLLEDGPRGTTSDHAGTGRRRLQQHPPGPHLPDHGMDDGRAGQRHGEQVLLGLFGPLLDGERDLLGLAVAEADAAGTVPDHHERGEREAPAALDDLGHAVDGDDPRLTQARHIGGGHQNSNPASRAASAAAFTRPWKRKPPRSNTTWLTPAALARSATSRPAVVDAVMLPVGPAERMSGSTVAAAATVRPLTSSITWRIRWRLERNTARRGRSGVPVIFLRTRWWRRRRASRRILEMSAMTGCSDHHFLPALPALRMMRSPAYLTPLPL